MRVFCVALLSLVVLTGCTGDGDDAGADDAWPVGVAGGAFASGPDEPAFGTWRLRAAQAPDLAALLTEARAAPEITFGSDGKVRATDGCNSHVATYDLDGDALQLDDQSTTLAGCVDHLSHLYADLLDELEEVAVDDDTLALRAGPIVLVHRSEGAAGALRDVEWRLVDIRLPSAEHLPGPAGAEPTISFDDGTVRGRSGCGSYEGAYVRPHGDGPWWYWSPNGAVGTAGGCDDGAMIEGAYLALLRLTRRVTIDGDELRLDGFGGANLAFTR
ncbi:MAG: META domain-containing protein [Actinomycetota bacterium]|nr:META domain-containing protein [Actinomycetota bacterium]